MSATRITSLLAVLLATAGLAAVPAGALAQDEPIDEEIEFVEEDMWCDDDVAGADDDEFVEEDDEAELRQLSSDDEEFFDEQDEDFLGPGEDDEGLEDEPSDDELFDDCLAAEGEELDEEGVSETVETDTTRLARRGVLTAKLFVPGRAVIESVLTRGGATARMAKRQVLGSAHRRVTRAGRVSLKVKLTPKGRRVVRKAKRKLRLVLTTHVTLAGGPRLTRSTRIRL